MTDKYKILTHTHTHTHLQLYTKNKYEMNESERREWVSAQWVWNVGARSEDEDDFQSMLAAKREMTACQSGQQICVYLAFEYNGLGGKQGLENVAWMNEWVNVS